MQLKKRIVTMLAGIALLAFGVFTACDTATNPEKANENQKQGGNDSSFIKVETTNEGIKFSYDEIPENISDLLIQLLQKDKKSLTELRINSLTTNYLIDKYVDANTEYDCYISWKNADGTSDGIEPLSVKTTAGLGEVRLSNQPAVSFDSKNNTVTFTTLPEFSEISNLDWGCNFGYHLKDSKNEKWCCLYNGISKNDTNVIRTIYDDVEFGTWNRCNYIVWFNCEGFEYKHFEWDDLSKIENMPETINLVDNKPKLFATPVDEGIKFEWKNIPEGCSNWYVRLNKKDKESLTELRLCSMSATSIIDKYVDANSEYSCYIRWENSDGTWDSSKTISVTPTNGLGEAKITNQPAASFDSQNKTIIFETLPEFSALQDINWRCVFGYKLKETGDWDWIYNAIYKNNSNKVYSIFDETASGNWILCDYIVSFNDDDFEYKHYEDDISELNGIPNPILLSDENRFSLLATPVSDGIKLEWKNLPEGTTHIAIFPKGESQAKFLIYNLTDIHYVIDKHVETGKQYSYSLSARNEKNLGFADTGDTNTVTATAGLGEAEYILTATASADGIHLSVPKSASGDSVRIEKTSVENPTICKEWFDTDRSEISDSVTEINFTDPFVTAGKEYIYKVTLESSNYQDKDIIEIMYYKPVTIKSISTGEKLVITNQPAGTYDEMTKTLTFTTKPEIASVDGVDIWNISLDYNRQSGASSGFGIFDIKENTDTCEAWSGAGNGTFYLCAYRIWSYFDNYIRYHVENSDISNLSGLPQSVKL